MQHPLACGIFEEDISCIGEKKRAMSFLANFLCPGSAGIRMLWPLRTALLNEGRGTHQPYVLWVLWSCHVALPCISLSKGPVLAP